MDLGNRRRLLLKGSDSTASFRISTSGLELEVETRDLCNRRNLIMMASDSTASF
jgi:hypothetical protein